MATDGLSSWPMALKICRELGAMLIHSPSLGIFLPVSGFCATYLLVIFNASGFNFKTGHWPWPCFGVRVPTYMTEVCARFQRDRACTSQVIALQILQISRHSYIATDGLIS